MTSFRFLIPTLLLIIGVCSGCIPGPPSNCNFETIEYACIDGESLVMDVYSPLHQGPDAEAPLFVYFHGGTWVAGSRDKIRQRYRNHVVESLVDSGCVVVSVEYRLVDLDGHSLMHSLADCRAALDYVRSHGDIFHNPHSNRKIVVWGSSSGAQLALMTAYSDTVTGSGRIACLVDDFGPVDLVSALDTLPGWAKTKVSGIFFGQDVSDAEAFDSLARIYSSICHINRNIPVMIFHGSNDDVVSPIHSYTLSDSLGPEISDIRIFEGYGHGFHSLDSSHTRAYITSLWDFLHRHLDGIDAK